MQKKSALIVLKYTWLTDICSINFFSPISNKRSDDYGGNLKNRSRLLIEVFKIVRKVWPKNRLLGARITGSDNLKNGSNINDAVFLSKELKKLKADYVAVTSGGIKPKTNIKFFPGYNVKFAKRIKEKVRINVIALGMLNSINLINKILKKKCRYCCRLKEIYK